MNRTAAHTEAHDCVQEITSFSDRKGFIFVVLPQSFRENLDEETTNVLKLYIRLGLVHMGTELVETGVLSSENLVIHERCFVFVNSSQDKQYDFETKRHCCSDYLASLSDDLDKILLFLPLLLRENCYGKTSDIMTEYIKEGLHYCVRKGILDSRYLNQDPNVLFIHCKGYGLKEKPRYEQVGTCPPFKVASIKKKGQEEEGAQLPSNNLKHGPFVKLRKACSSAFQKMKKKLHF